MPVGVKLTQLFYSLSLYFEFSLFGKIGFSLLMSISNALSVSFLKKGITLCYLCIISLLVHAIMTYYSHFYYLHFIPEKKLFTNIKFKVIMVTEADKHCKSMSLPILSAVLGAEVCRRAD